MIVTFSPEVEKRVLATAAKKGLDLNAYFLSLVQKDWELPLSLEPSNGIDSNGNGEDYDPDALNRMIASLTNRTIEQKREARERAIQQSQPKIQLPPGVSVFEVMPVIRGDETDEEVIAALQELS
ncbi:MAG: hypothetical protein HOP19_23715 [Acidobacteria bacterium]|nr:hypothetical protein [Acidobacteriota bacterium]